MNINVTVSAQVYDILRKITKTGLGGATIEKTADEMIREGIRHTTEGSGLLAVEMRDCLIHFMNDKRAEAKKSRK